jgi:hypothetical protein
MEFVTITLKNGEIYSAPAETFGQFLSKRGITSLDIESIVKA